VRPVAAAASQIIHHTVLVLNGSVWTVSGVFLKPVDVAFPEIKVNLYLKWHF